MVVGDSAFFRVKFASDSASGTAALKTTIVCAGKLSAADVLSRHGKTATRSESVERKSGKVGCSCRRYGQQDPAFCRWRRRQLQRQTPIFIRSSASTRRSHVGMRRQIFLKRLRQFMRDVGEVSFFRLNARRHLECLGHAEMGRMRFLS